MGCLQALGVDIGKLQDSCTVRLHELPGAASRHPQGLSTHYALGPLCGCHHRELRHFLHWGLRNGYDSEWSQVTASKLFMRFAQVAMSHDYFYAGCHIVRRVCFSPNDHRFQDSFWSVRCKRIGFMSVVLDC